MPPQKRLLELDALRAVAIGLILLHHLPPYVWSDAFVESIWFLDYEAFPIFSFGLSLFFFVSGYALYYSNRTISSLQGAGNFFKKRAIRIYPFYWIAIAAFIIVGIGTWDDLTWTLIQVCGAQGLLSPLLGTPVVTLWFVGVILLFYLVYPFVVSSSSELKQLIYALLTPLLLFAVLRFLFDLVDFRFFAYYAIFFSGFVASKYDVLNRLTVKRSYAAISILLLVPVLVLIAYNGTSLHPHAYLWLDAAATPLTDLSVLAIILADVLGLLFVYITFVISRLILPSLSSTSRKVVSGIALSSYCVYLFHRPFLALLDTALDTTFLTAFEKNVIVILIGIPVLFIASYALQRGWDIVLAKVLTRRQPRASGATHAK